jgi:hypothetical protein
MQVIVYGLTMAIHGVADDTSRIDGLSIQRIGSTYVAYSPDLREVLEVNHMHESRRYVSTVQCLDKQMRNLKTERDDLCRRIDRFNEQSLWARLRAVFAGDILE